ncbi:ACT domain-containing protein ACR10-like isoform X2 [Phoenix dactylifera]|nr:ACT domain-containing protein ACR10-like isoform X2 [Phoenix dactylifera]
MSTDGKWCYILFWVVERGKKATRWGLLKKRLLGACPVASSLLGMDSYYYGQLETEHQSQVFLLKFSCYDRLGLLHDVTQVLCELELTIRRVKVSTTPDGKVMDLFFITDTRELLHTKSRRDETCAQLKAVLGDFMTSCDIEVASSEVAACLLASSSLPYSVMEEMFNLELPDEPSTGSFPTSNNPSVIMDNTLSPAHTLIQLYCHDHKSLLYDIMRALKDYNIQISYGRFYASHNENCEIDLFVTQIDGKKIVDPNKQKALCDRLTMELSRPLRVMVVNRGPDTELLVANPVELSGKGRPLVFYDITLALKMLGTCIFLAEIGRHVAADREWEVYRIHLGDDLELTASRNKIVEGVTKMLMGWD